MAVELRSLRVSADFDASSYVRGIEQKVNADRQAVASSNALAAANDEVAQSQERVGAKILPTVNVLERLSRQYIDGYGTAQRFNAEILKLARSTDTQAASVEHLERVYTGMRRQFGLVADATTLATLGYNDLATAINNVNARLGATEVAAERAAAAQKQLHAANQNVPGVRGFDAANLGYQFQDVAVTAAMGMNPLMIGLQQGTQLAAIVSTMEKPVAGLAAAFGSLLGPVSLVTIGLTAGAAALIQYFSTWTDRASGVTAEMQKQNDLIVSIANKWGSATPALAAYAEQLNSVKGATEAMAAANAAAQQELGKVEDVLGGINRQYTAAIRDLRGGGVDTQETVASLTQTFRDLQGGILDGTATYEQLTSAQSALSNAISRFGTPALAEFSAAFDRVVPRIREAVDQAARFRTEAGALSGVDLLKKYGGRGVYDNVFRSSDFTMQNNLLPEYGPIPTRRPLRELDVDQAYRDQKEIENRRRLQEADLAARRARSPSELEAAARAREEANVIDGESDPMRVSRISLAGTRARVEAEYQLAEAQKERMRGLNESVQWQQMEISLLGKTQGEMVALQSAYSMISRVREEAARNNIRVDERELAMIQQKAVELGRLADLYARLQLRGELQFERDQLFRSDQDQQIASRLRSSGLAVDFESAEAKMIRENMRISELRSDLKGFFSDFRDGLMQGESFGEALGNAILNALSNSLTRWTDRLFDSAITSLLGGGSGSFSGFTPNTTLGAFLGAANDNRMGGYSGLGASQAIATGAQSITGGAVDLAMRMLGQTETANAGSINAFMAAGGVDLDAATSAWCAGFVNSALKQIGVDGTGSSVANSFQNWGRLINPSEVMRGDVLLQSRGLGASSLGGHVGLATGASRFVGGQQQLQMLSGNYDNSVGLAWINAQELQVRRATEAASSLGKLSDSSGMAMQGLGSLGSGLNQFGATLSRAMGGGTGGFNVSSLFGSLSNAGWNMGILSSSSQVLGAVMKGSWGLWDDGGYTGPGGKHDVAGLVHRGEVVWSQEDVARWGGAGNVDAMRRGLRGYAEGGIVGDRRRVVGMPASSTGGERVRVIETVKEVRIAYDEQGNPYKRMREIAREESDIIASQRADEVRGELPDRMNAWQRNPYRRGA